MYIIVAIIVTIIITIIMAQRLITTHQQNVTLIWLPRPDRKVGL